jgi:hypothetical protein
MIVVFMLTELGCTHLVAGLLVCALLALHAAKLTLSGTHGILLHDIVFAHGHGIVW